MIYLNIVSGLHDEDIQENEFTEQQIDIVIDKIRNEIQKNHSQLNGVTITIEY